MTEQDQLLQARSSIKASLTRIKTFLTKFNIDVDDIHQIANRNKKIEEIWAKYETIQSSLETIEFEVHKGDREIFESNDYKIKSQLEKVIESKTNQQSIHEKSFF